MGGEKLCPPYGAHNRSGSPPRGRGKGHGCHQTAVVVGITPAWAGKRSQVAAALQSGWDHPRVGGEKTSRLSMMRNRGGSPPRGRGKVSTITRRWPGAGITPAWAGKRPAVWSSKSKNGDHPRVGGEKFERWLNYGYGRGSPPRGRGKALLTECRYGVVGITPAWAGKSNNQPATSGICRDHPRVGGEKHPMFRMICGCGGSPPRGRGKELSIEN